MMQLELFADELLAVGTRVYLYPRNLHYNVHLCLRYGHGKIVAISYDKIGVYYIVQLTRSKTKRYARRYELVTCNHTRVTFLRLLKRV